MFSADTQAYRRLLVEEQLRLLREAVRRRAYEGPGERQLGFAF